MENINLFVWMNVKSRAALLLMFIITSLFIFASPKSFLLETSEGKAAVDCSSSWMLSPWWRAYQYVQLSRNNLSSWQSEVSAVWFKIIIDKIPFLLVESHLLDLANFLTASS